MNQIPKLPDSINKILVILTPIYAGFYGLVGFLGVAVIASLLLRTQVGFSEIISSLNQKSGGSLETFGILMGLVTGVILFVSVIKLIKKQLLGWQLLLTAELIKLISAVLFNLDKGIDFVSLSISVIALYLILQLRPYYK